MKKKILNIILVGAMLIGMVYILSGCGKANEEEANNSNEFYMTVQEAYTITGRGTSINGQIEQGSLKIGDEIVIITLDGTELNTKVEQIVVQNKQVEETSTTDELVRILVKDIDRKDIERGQTIIKKDSKISKDQILKKQSDFQEKLNSQKMSYTDYANKPDENESDDLLMAVDDVIANKATGVTIITKVSRGTAKVGDNVQIVGLSDKVIDTTIVSIGNSKGELSEANKDSNTINLVLDNIKSNDDIQRGQVIVKPNSIKAHKKFSAKIYVLTNEEGGRKTSIPDNYSTNFYFRKTDTTGTLKLLDNVQSANLGEECNIEVELKDSFAMEVNTKFAIREGGRTIAYGFVTETYD